MKRDAICWQQNLHIRSNKDASEGRYDDRISQIDISQIGLLVACYKLSTGVLQAVYRLFADYLHSGIHISAFPVMLCRFHSFSELNNDASKCNYLNLLEFT